MDIYYATLETCHAARGAVVVIDVLRAFTTAAFAFAAGAREIWLVSDVQQAFDLRRQQPDLRLMGEVGGLPIQGFDFSNSPSALQEVDLRGRRLVQRTSAGTQGVVRSTQADLLLASSFVCAQATTSYLLGCQPESITFVVTGVHDGMDGDEDRACADYIAALLLGENPDPNPYLERVKASFAGRMFRDPGQHEFPEADLVCALDVNRFNFAMRVERENGQLVLKRMNRDGQDRQD